MCHQSDNLLAILDEHTTIISTTAVFLHDVIQESLFPEAQSCTNNTDTAATVSEHRRHHNTKRDNTSLTTEKVGAFQHLRGCPQLGLKLHIHLF